jgi:uncharacterized protein YaiI (UPF0178 family)
MRIWVDADSAPRDAKEIVYRTAKRLAIDAVFVANRRLALPLDNPRLSSVIVHGGPDVADQHIAENADAGDVVVTHDIPLAAILVEKDVVVVDPRGDVFTKENVGERLSVRNFLEAARAAGIETGGSAPYSPRDRHAFAAALDRELTRKR